MESLTTDTSRHSRGSVLRLSGESRGVGGLLPKRLCLDGTGGRDTNVASIEVEVDPSDFDGTLMVVTVGEDEEVVSPSNPSCGKERRGTLRLCLSSSQDRSPKPSPAEPSEYRAHCMLHTFTPGVCFFHPISLIETNIQK